MKGEFIVWQKKKLFVFSVCMSTNRFINKYLGTNNAIYKMQCNVQTSYSK